MTRCKCAVRRLTRAPGCPMLASAGTPDGDFIDVDVLLPPGWQPGVSPLLVLLHGLEGSSQSHYARAFASWAQQRGWAYVVPHFRGCSGEPIRAPRFYHSGDHEEIDWMLKRVVAQWGGPVSVVGVSLGAMRCCGGRRKRGRLRRSWPRLWLRLLAAGPDRSGACHWLGFQTRLLQPHVHADPQAQGAGQLQHYLGLFDEQVPCGWQDLYAYDAIVTAPCMALPARKIYWTRCSSRPGLKHLRDDHLVLECAQRPLLPAWSLPGVHDVGLPSHCGSPLKRQGTWVFRPGVLRACRGAAAGIGVVVGSARATNRRGPLNAELFEIEKRHG